MVNIMVKELKWMGVSDEKTVDNDGKMKVSEENVDRNGHTPTGWKKKDGRFGHCSILGIWW